MAQPQKRIQENTNGKIKKKKGGWIFFMICMVWNEYHLDSLHMEYGHVADMVLCCTGYPSYVFG